mmetsp:Transcript_17467/g.35498  ORF Transcript_17467/g.35498 Transcript_17467/m.35498 type:complete len:187 (+) Transcript_17467:80-640(+)
MIRLAITISVFLSCVLMGLIPLPFSTKTSNYNTFPFAFTLPFKYDVNPYFGVSLSADRRPGARAALDYWFDSVFLVDGTLEVEGGGCSVGFGGASLPRRRRGGRRRTAVKTPLRIGKLCGPSLAKKEVVYSRGSVEVLVKGVAMTVWVDCWSEVHWSLKGGRVDSVDCAVWLGGGIIRSSFASLYY